MIVLVEAYHYTEESLNGLLDTHYLFPVAGGRVKINCVGYLKEEGQPHSVLILPKAFLDSTNCLLGGYKPEDLLTLNDENSLIRKQLQTSGKLDFLFHFSVWLYRAIQQFKQRNASSELPELANLLDVSDAGKTSLSELELIMALVRFHHDNNALLTHIKRFNTAQRHTVSWSRTVARKRPVLQNGKPVYAEPVVKQKHINYDEELIVLYLSTLAALRQEYGFRLELNPLYILLSARDMERFQAQAKRRLKQIKGRYFSDKLLYVWQLLYQYYDRQEQLRTNRSFREVLLVRDFNVVFEDMIDYLLSDPKESLPKTLKDQPDGKRVDHIYAYRDLIWKTGLLKGNEKGDEVYHIGDSKYYHAGNEIGTSSISKQFTYARNVIQQNIDLLLLNKDKLNEDKLSYPLRYRDYLTEGYNPTPNFFISATVNSELSFTSDDLKTRSRGNASIVVNRHFEGRLFDRDTLLLQAYNINFLYVLHTYVAKNVTQRDLFRKNTRSKFRQNMVDNLRSNYSFFKVTPHNNDLDTFVTKHFRRLAGKMYRPSGFDTAILLAIEKNIKEDLYFLDANVEQWDLE